MKDTDLPKSPLELIVTQLRQFGKKELGDAILRAYLEQAYRYEEYDELARIAFKLKDYKTAMKLAENAVLTAKTGEQMYMGRANLINVYNHANYPEKAMTLIRMQEAVLPDDVDTRLEKAFSFFLMNDRDSAEKILQAELDKGTSDEETTTKLKFNLGTYAMWRDEFQKGLRLFLHEGEKLDYWRKHKLPGEFWSGGPQPGRTIYLYAEAGIGDEVINVRFMKHLAATGMNPVWVTDRAELASIFNRNGFKSITPKEIRGTDYLWTYPMSLPVYLNLEYPDLWYGPYLTASGQNSLVTASGKKKIGIRWQGNPAYDHDLHRSVPLADIYSAVKHVDADFYSLQRDTGLEELPNFPGLVPLHNDLKSINTLMDTIADLDLVITSCTSIAHIAAAMGKETIILTPISAYYTWTHSTPKSPWYGDHVTLLRQERPRSWKEPTERLRALM
jgi:tetratricopeptide (TPR) repeat protein